MTISAGDQLPDATFLRSTDFEVEQIASRDVFDGRNVVLFALPGAYTATCDSRHVPSFMKVADQLRAKGIDEIVCLATNDPWVMEAWGKSTGGLDAGISFLSDPESAFTASIDMIMDAPAVGFHKRSKRYSLYAENGIVKIYNPEVARGSCEISGGDALLAQL